MGHGFFMGWGTTKTGQCRAPATTRETRIPLLWSWDPAQLESNEGTNPLSNRQGCHRRFGLVGFMLYAATSRISSNR